LAYLLYQLPDALKYKTFTIPKRSGGKRTISAPDKRLKLVQRRLAELLEACQLEVDEKEGVEAACVVAHGFKRGLSISTNAARHRRRRWVFNADLSEFFPSINFGRVYGFFLRNRHYSLQPKVAAAIAQIACFKDTLPQGSPSSPIISNLIANVLDVRLVRIAASAGCTYTRYADDLTFSTDEKRFPMEIARQVSADEWSVSRKLKRAVGSSGFSVNPQKTRMQYRSSRQEVTGLVVNARVNVKSDYYRLARAMTNRLVTGGAPEFPDLRGAASRSQLRGMLNFIYSTKQTEATRSQIERPNVGWAYEDVYRQFLDYDWFYGLERPTLLCEGKTDNIYLAAAIKARAAQFPSLVAINGKEVALDVRLFRYSPTSAVLQALSGGTGELNNLLSTYRARIRKFKGGASHPTIIIVDNDSGAKGLFSHIKSITKSKTPVDGTEKFYFIYENLYVVPIPMLSNSDTPIERLFEPSLLKKKIGVRELDLTGDKSTTTHYSKSEFAVQIVKQGGANVKFDGFDPLLAALVEVKKDYAKRLGAANQRKQ